MESGALLIHSLNEMSNLVQFIWLVVTAPLFTAGKQEAQRFNSSYNLLWRSHNGFWNSSQLKVWYCTFIHILHNEPPPTPRSHLQTTKARKNDWELFTLFSSKNPSCVAGRAWWSQMQQLENETVQKSCAFNSYLKRGISPLKHNSGWTQVRSTHC